MRLLLLCATALTAATLNSTSLFAQTDERATLLLEDDSRHELGLGRPDHPDFLHGPVTWSVSDDGARATAYFDVPARLKGSIGFLADKTLASPSRTMILRLDLADFASDPIVNVLVPSVDALGFPTGPRLNGIVSRRDNDTFDVRLDETKAAENAKAIGFGNTLDITFQLKSGRIGRISVDRDIEGAKALARLFSPVSGTDQEKAIYKYEISNEQAEADAAAIMFGNATSGVACFARFYDAAHLRSHPHQQVAAISMKVQMAPSRPDDWAKTRARWTFAVRAVRRNGVGAGTVAARVCEVKRVLKKDDLHNALLLSACGAAVEDAPDQFTLTNDAKRAVYSPLDENGYGATWPAPGNVTNTDDYSFMLERTYLDVCAQMERPERGGTPIIVRPGYADKEL
jgi:hypothetical protein